VTPAAVGQQVRSLEAFLNLTLFHRGADGLEETRRAQEALPALRRGFDEIAEAVRLLTSDASSTGLRISVAPSVGMNWLMPRLPGFYKRHPGIEISIDALFQLANLARGEADIAIRFGTGRYQGLISERIVDEYVVPLCSPELRDCHGLRRIGDLEHAPLVHLVSQTTDDSWPAWDEWADSHGLDRRRFARGPIFTRSGIAMALQAAAGSHGVALTGLFCAVDDILAGRLVAPFGPEGAVKTRYGYDLVFTAALSETRPVAAFRTWAKSEARATRQVIESIVQPGRKAAE
jgi:LysR family glycine cleavage system transcriptional activator